MEWTDERVAILKDMWTNGYSARQIADSLGGTTRNAVIGKAHRMGFCSRKAQITHHQPIALPRVMERNCQWPVGHPGQDGFHFCGAEAVIGKPYCQSHCAVAYRHTSADAA